MHILSLVASKGGVGKTTLAAHIAVEASRAGLRVVVIDLDPQGSLVDWHNAREANDIAIGAQITPATLPSALHTLSQSFDLAIIDTPPGIAIARGAAIEAATLALIPCLPSPIDIRAIGPTVEQVREAGTAFSFVLNRADFRQKIATQTALLLSQHGPAAPEPVRYLADFSAAMIDGRTAQEIAPTGAAAVNIATLWKYLDTTMRKATK